MDSRLAVPRLAPMRLRLLLVSLPLLPTPACLVAAAAAAGAGAVYVSGKDSADFTIDRSEKTVYDAAETELRAAGWVKHANAEGGYLDGEAFGSDVKIYLSRVDSKTKVRVEARKHLQVSPHAGTAERLANRILERAMK